LLETLLRKKNYTADGQFEAQALCCIALDKLCKLLRSNDIVKKGLIAEIQANWVASIGTDKLDSMLANRFDQANQLLKSLTNPTQAQKTLKKQLDKIEQ
jgi:hypothetical protein